MSGLQFGKELKLLRTKAGIGSKELSIRIGKAITYVSQLERGLIKNPDYTACYQLLKEVGINEEKIEVYLESFDILSPEREKFLQQWNIENLESRNAEIETNPNAFLEKWTEWYEEDTTIQLKESTDNLRKMLNVFIEKDLTRAKKVIENIGELLANRENFEFLCQLFEYNLSELTPSQRNELINEIQSKYQKKK